MTRKLTIFNDLHLGSIYAMKDLAKGLLEGRSDTDTYLLGDVIDLGNCRSEELEQWVHLAIRLSEAYSGRYIPGNHERGLLGSHKLYAQIGPTILAHGDFEWWGQEKAWANWKEPRGRGPLGYYAKSVMNWARAFTHSGITQEFLDRVVRLCNGRGATRYICGHRHPPERLTATHKGIEVIVLPRGRSEVFLDD